MDIIGYYDQIYMQIQDIGSRRSDAFYASDASVVTKNHWGEYEVIGKCLRAQYYRMTQTPMPAVSMGNTRKMDYGNAVHAHEVTRMQAARILVAAEVPFYDPEHNISGRVDALTINPFSKSVPVEIMGAEIKSVGGYYGKKGVITPDANGEVAPKIEHVLQTGPYIHWFSRRFQRNITWMLLYYSRDDGEYGQHVIALTNEGFSVNGQLIQITIEQIYDRWKLLTEHLQAKALPPRDYQICYNRERLLKMADRQQLNKTERSMVLKNKPIDKGDWQCQYCDHKVQCYQKENQ